jgi:hypothetical protein
MTAVAWGGLAQMNWLCCPGFSYLLIFAVIYAVWGHYGAKFTYYILLLFQLSSTHPYQMSQGNIWWRHCSVKLLSLMYYSTSQSLWFALVMRGYPVPSFVRRDGTDPTLPFEGREGWIAVYRGHSWKKKIHVPVLECIRTQMMKLSREKKDIFESNLRKVTINQHTNFELNRAKHSEVLARTTNIAGHRRYCICFPIFIRSNTFQNIVTK